jgi:hypothetical protein
MHWANPAPIPIVGTLKCSHTLKNAKNTKLEDTNEIRRRTPPAHTHWTLYSLPTSKQRVQCGLLKIGHRSTDSMPMAMRTTRSYAYDATTPDDHYLHVGNVRGKPADRLQPATASRSAASACMANYLLTPHASLGQSQHACMHTC